MKTFLRLFQATKRGNGPALPIQIKQFLSYFIQILLFLLFFSTIILMPQPEIKSLASNEKAPKRGVRQRIFQEHQSYLWEDRVGGQLYVLPFNEQVSVNEIRKAFKTAVDYAVESADPKLIVWKQLNGNLIRVFTRKKYPNIDEVDTEIRRYLPQIFQINEEEISSISVLFPRKLFEGSSFYFNLHDPLLVPEEYKTLQEAISVAEPGSTIEINKGEYTENLEIDKSLYINGTDSDRVTLKGPQKDKPIINVSLSEEKTGALSQEIIVEGQGVHDMSRGERKRTIQAIIDRLKKRLDYFGIKNEIIIPYGKERIHVEIPKTREKESLRKMLNLVLRTGLLEFKKIVESGSPGSSLSPSDLSQEVIYGRAQKNGKRAPYLVKKAPLMIGKVLKNAQVKTSQNSQNPIYVELQFNDEGAKKFAEAIKSLQPGKDRIAIVLDDVVQSAQVISQGIWDAANTTNSISGAAIEGNFTRDEAKQLVAVLNAGPYPVECNEVISILWRRIQPCPNSNYLKLEGLTIKGSGLKEGQTGVRLNDSIVNYIFQVPTFYGKLLPK